MAVNVKMYGAVGDGRTDDTAAIQQAINQTDYEVDIPQGVYRITAPLQVPSRRRIAAENTAKLIFLPDRPLVQGDFLLTNADVFGGNEDITLDGGVWDGGFGGKYNVKDDDIFAPNACSGACLNFVNVKNLHLQNLTVANSIVYHIRMSRLWDFTIRNVGFYSEKLAYNQDGLHFGGDVYNGVVENIRCLSKGQTNDDLLALNADDSTQRLENRGLSCGPIENIVFRNVYAEDCFTVIRMLSIASPIRHIRFENICAGYRHYAINMDGARYCRTPLFVESGAFNGTGCIEDITIDNMQVYNTDKTIRDPAIMLESHADAFSIRNFTRQTERNADPDRPLLSAKNLTRQHVFLYGEHPLEMDFTAKTDRLEVGGTMTGMDLSTL